MIINKGSLTALFRGFKAVFSAAVAKFAPASQWKLVAMEVSSDTKTEDYGWLGSWTRFRQWIGDREFQALKQHGYSITNVPFENSVEVDRDDIEDDRFGIYTPLIQQMGQDSVEHPDELVFGLFPAGFSTLCYDGQFFFDTDHPVGATTVSNSGGGSGTAWYVLDLSRAIRPFIFQLRRDYEFVALDDPTDQNVFLRRKYQFGIDARCNAGYGLWQLAYGSKQTLDEANLAAAIAAMGAFKKDNGLPLGIRPTHLVVPPSLEFAARKLVDAVNNASGASNVLNKRLDVLVVPYLA